MITIKENTFTSYPFTGVHRIAALIGPGRDSITIHRLNPSANGGTS